MEYYVTKGDRIVCNLCAHRCSIKEGGSGLCKVNINEKGKLVTTVYGRPNALHVDPIEKKPLYHFLPGSKTLSLGTSGCNFACPFCQNWQLSQNGNVNKTLYISPKEIVELAKKEGSRIISFTYNEPTIFYPYAKDISLVAKNEGLETVYVSNGFFSQEVAQDLVANTSALNIDLKSFDESYYKKVLRGSLKTVLNNIEFCIKAGLWVEVTTLLVQGINDNDESIGQMARYFANRFGKNVPWHFSAFYPNYKMLDTPSTPIDTLQRAKNIAKNEGIKYIYLGNVGLNQNTLCPKCSEIAFKREGRAVEVLAIGGICQSCGYKIEGVW